MEIDIETSIVNEFIERFFKLDRPKADVEKIKKALDFACRLHKGQKRQSNEPYIVHPISVASILIDLKCDTETICAGLLHDVLEDTDIDVLKLEKEFGSAVGKLVEGVTKLGRLSFMSTQEHQAENFRKMLLAIAIDIRVVLVKIADRLHNMRTLNHLPPDKQKRISQETRDIFAPLAHRFGLNKAKNELEDLAFYYLEPDKYKEVERLVIGDQEYREKKIKEIILKIKTEMDKSGIKGEIYGRPKHFYSIYRKMQRLGSKELYDLLGVRIIVENVRQCYEIMGIIHDLFRPIPGKFKDYIAIPKPNMYQSLHTAVVGPHGRPVEIQIRTQEMHEIAEYGIAAHWKYKDLKGSTKADKVYDEKIAWISKLIEWQSELKDPEEYIDAIKLDLFSDEVFILSPKGDVIDLPRDSTPIDFAYRIHTDIGNKCIGAKVNGKMVPIDTKLRNGDIVEIITGKNPHPSLDWLNFAATNSAKNKIRQWFKKQHRELHVEQGKKLFENAFGENKANEIMSSDRFLEAVRKLNRATKDDLLASLGCGDLTMPQVKGKLGELQVQKEKEREFEESKEVSEVAELEGMLHNLAKCCSPLPGEDVVGVVSKGRGITVHRADCRNLDQTEKDRIMPLQWRGREDRKYPAGIEVECIDRVGVSRDILNKIADENINVRDLRVVARTSNGTAVIKIVAEVSDLFELKNIMSSIGRVGDVINVFRSGEHKRFSLFKNVDNTKNKNLKNKKDESNE
ncbi:MAG: bifunctional (p)ppGpp synthetase/guanosine-3',5'-bis(diphosphate) 3'-pyrophosphohydrolase [Candidatus Melainabacteria bacterium]|nr:bifunctional (p)ppGpp synthetase/guanosine-3',5'-bis(diphosphate) 3'-pyrophosphohydrolase [Candidatus Melainabacteria bacterium]